MKRFKHSLSNSKLLTCDMGKLVPCGMFQVIPGDTIQQATSMLVRVSPLMAPIMHKVEARVHHFFVPYRLIWDDWENFITGGPDGMDASVPPYREEFNITVGSLGDYLGLTPQEVAIRHSMLPIRAYDLIYNEYYRDQDLQTPITIAKTSGADTTTSMALQSICWEKDYFTVARPWAQKGPEITIPVAGDAPVRGIGPFNQTYTTGPATAYETDESGASSYAKYKTAGSNAGVNSTWLQIEEDPGNPGFPNIRAVLGDTAYTNVLELREALALQRYQEARAMYGSRYVEYLRYLGIRSSDARLQRPEYLGGGRQTIQFSEVLQTAPNLEDGSNVDDDLGVGELKGHGIGGLRSNRYRRFFEEHGLVLSLLSVRPKTMYVQGQPKVWNLDTKEDYYQKELAFVGQQEIKNKELYVAHATPNGTFGFTPRYDELRRIENTVAGEFRNSLDFWHMARIFSSDPALNNTFVTCDPTNRVYQQTTVDQLQISCHHSIQARRIVPNIATGHIY